MRQIKAKLYDVRNDPTIQCHIDNYLMYYRSESHNTSIIEEYENSVHDASNKHSYNRKYDAIAIFCVKYIHANSDLLLGSLKT